MFHQSLPVIHMALSRLRFLPITGISKTKRKRAKPGILISTAGYLHCNSSNTLYVLSVSGADFFVISCVKQKLYELLNTLK